MMTLPAPVARTLAREQSRLAQYWEFVAPTIVKRPFLAFGLWVRNEHGAVSLATALANAGFQSPEVVPGRRWFRQGWHVSAASRVKPDVTQGTVNALLEQVVTIGAHYGAHFVGWGALPQWPAPSSSAA
jgi:hypothetical protein